MGMHLAYVAARAPVSRLRESFFRTWPKFEIVAVADDFPDADSIWAWKSSHEKFVSAAQWTRENPGQEVYVFWQDGPWAVMMDNSYTLASDKNGLNHLSSEIGIVVSFVVESAGASAFFWYFENGVLRRSINNDGNDISVTGEAIPEEAGIDISDYYMDETEALMNAFGLPHESIQRATNREAVCVIDRTDYSHLASNMSLAAISKKPWWKLW